MRILITGSSGFVGSMLTLRLLDSEHELRALAREPSRVHEGLESQSRRDRFSRTAGSDWERVEVVRGDVLDGDSLPRAFEGVDLAYYLIHSMESFSAGSFPERERRAAENFARAAAAAGVGRIVYLGGLTAAGQPGSPHLASRLEVENILLSAVPDSVALRASIVIGAGSRSFRLLVRLIERMPILTLPSWRRFRTQPIDARDVIEMLTGALTLAPADGYRLDLGGPQILSYEQMIGRIAQLMLVRRPAMSFKVSLTPFTGRVAAAIAGEDPELIVALMEGLQSDLLVNDDQAARLFGVRLHSFDSAVEHALGEWEAAEPLAAR